MAVTHGLGRRGQTNRRLYHGEAGQSVEAAANNQASHPAQPWIQSGPADAHRQVVWLVLERVGFTPGFTPASS